MGVTRTRRSAGRSGCSFGSFKPREPRFSQRRRQKSLPGHMGQSALARPVEVRVRRACKRPPGNLCCRDVPSNFLISSGTFQV